MVPLKATMDKALESCLSVQKVFVTQRSGNEAFLKGDQVELEEVMGRIEPFGIGRDLTILFFSFQSVKTGVKKVGTFEEMSLVEVRLWDIHDMEIQYDCDFFCSLANGPAE